MSGWAERPPAGALGAATTAKVVGDTREWVAAGPAREIELAVPCDEADGPPERAHPSVFELFVPGAERLAQGERQAPCIAVQLLGASDGPRGERRWRMRLELVAWSPGHWDGDGFHRTSDGWRDLANGLDVLARAVGRAERIAGMRVDAAAGIGWGLSDMDGEIPDLWPFWRGHVDFELAGGQPASPRHAGLL